MGHASQPTLRRYPTLHVLRETEFDNERKQMMLHLIDSPASRRRFRQFHEELKAQGFENSNLERLMFEVVIPRLQMTEVDPFWARRSPAMFTPRHPVPNFDEIPSPLRLLIRAFHQNETVRRDELEAILSTSSIGALVESGMMSEDGPLLTPNVSLTECYGGLFASDRVDRYTEHDAVLRPHVSTAMIEWFLPVPQPLSKAVDIGVGTGVLSVMMNRRYGATIHAVDKNERAVEFCKFNAVMNDVDAIEVFAADHASVVKVPSLAGAVDILVWNMPATFWVHDAMCWGFPSTAIGERTVAEVYEALPTLLSQRGVAVVRHESKVPVSWLDTRLRAVPGTDALQVVYVHESEAAHLEREQIDQMHKDNWEDGTPQYDPTYVLGLGVTRRRRDPKAALVSYLPLQSWEDWAEFKGDRWQKQFASLPGWTDYRIVPE
jgi:tRNA1(Val) A37 N6-methylase TrmN6